MNDSEVSIFESDDVYVVLLASTSNLLGSGEENLLDSLDDILTDDTAI